MNLGRSEYLKMKEIIAQYQKQNKELAQTLQEIRTYAESMNWKSIVKKINATPMVWSTKYPKKDGLYWCKMDEKEPTIVQIYNCERGFVEYGAMVAFIGTDWDKSLCDLVNEFECTWCGPLSPGD